MLSLLCLFLPGLLVCLPALATVLWWQFKGREANHPFPLAAAGVGLMGLSFVTLPWLQFSPLERIGLDWLYDVAPFAGRLLELLGIDNLDRATPFLRAIGIRPPGWLALALNAQTWTGLLFFLLAMAVSGFLMVVLAQWIALRRRARLSASILALLSVGLLLLLVYHLPDIDGLGEHDFSNIAALSMLVIVNVHLSWMGPLAMVLGLAMVLVDGLRRLQG